MVESHRDETKIKVRLFGPDLPVDELVIGPQGLRVGRSADNSLTLNHREISRQHLRITWRDDQYFVEDLNSSNGVWLNDQRVESRQPRQINVGDVIRLGPFLMTVEDVIVEAKYYPVPSGPPSSDVPLPPVSGGKLDYPPGIPRDRSTWLQYLPAIYSEDEFLGRYLLIFESMMMPIMWVLDNFDMLLSPELAPEEWLRWMSSWFDLLMAPELPVERQRVIMSQIGWLFLRRGTRIGLQRLLELYFGTEVVIVEDSSTRCHFTVRLSLAADGPGREAADMLIQSQKPAFASYTLEIA